MSRVLRALAVALLSAMMPALVHAQTASQAAVQATRITEPQVRALVERVTAAANRRDIATIMQPLAPDVVVRLDMRGPDGKRQRLKLNRAQYETYLRDGLAALDKYSVKRGTLDVSIAPDGQTATVNGSSREVAEYQGTTIVAAVDDSTTLALRNGQIVVTAVHGVMR